MKKLKNYINVIQYPDGYNGENKKGHYFEGWYFKLQINQSVIAFIPGISKNKKDPHSFIQAISTELDQPLYFQYPKDEMKYYTENVSVTISDNLFNTKGIHIQLEDEHNSIKGTVFFEANTALNKSKYAPSIMGPFSYLPNLECNHQIISLHHKLRGSLNINGKDIDFTNGTGYIEKDWGTNFPNSWKWLQCNSFQSSEKASIVLSIADVNIPIIKTSFKGFFAVVQVGDKQYRFATYSGARIYAEEIIDNTLRIIICKNKYKLVVHADISEGKSGKIKAPDGSGMEREISEHIYTNIKVKLMKNNQVLFLDKGYAASMEISNDGN